MISYQHCFIYLFFPPRICIFHTICDNRHILTFHRWLNCIKCSNKPWQVNQHARKQDPATWKQPSFKTPMLSLLWQVNLSAVKKFCSSSASQLRLQLVWKCYIFQPQSRNAKKLQWSEIQNVELLQLNGNLLGGVLPESWKNRSFFFWHAVSIVRANMNPKHHLLTNTISCLW